MKTFLILAAGAVLTVHPLANEDVLEPSVENEVDHALSRVPTNLVLSAVSPTNVVVRQAFAWTNGLSRMKIAIRLVSEQGRDGRWWTGTNDVSSTAVRILEWCRE